MNKEEKKAIEYIRKEFIEDYRRKQQRINKDAFQIYVDKEDIDNLETVLKLIEMQTKELETYKKIAEKLADECTMFKKIQQISLDNEYSNGLVYMTKEEVLYWAKGVINNDK